MFSGDFRQILPVVPRGTRADEVNACLKSSHLWKYVKCLNLETNMRVQLQGDINVANFSNWLLQIGNGTFPVDNDGFIKLSEQFCHIVNTIDELISVIYPNINDNITKNNQWWCDRAILTCKNEVVNYINNYMIQKIDSFSMTYLSIDNTCDPDNTINYPIEFLNSLEPSGLPSHKICLKIGIPIMMLRNLNPPELCNGTRLIIINLHNNVIEAKIITGQGQGKNVFIPRIPMIPTDYPFLFKRVQFPIRPCLSITINKAQGQTLKVLGIDLNESCFTHGQLYVALSRIGNPNNLHILLPSSKLTQNIVYKEIL